MSYHRYAGRKGLYAASLVVLTLFSSSCDLAKNQMTFDRSAELDRQEYRDALAPQPLPMATEESFPDFAPLLSTPEELKLPSPLVTVSVNQTVSLRDLMFELADQASIDLELDPQIQGSVIFTAKERPFDEVVDRLCQMAGLRYKFVNHVLRVELDRPYIKTYSVDYINLVRSGESEMSAEVSMGGGSGGEESGGSTSGGSSAGVSSESEVDVWGDLSENIEQILAASDTYMTLATLADPVSSVVADMPVDPMAAGAPPSLPGMAGASPMGAQAVAGVIDPMTGLPMASPLSPSTPPTLNVSSVVGEPLVPNPPATFSLNRQAGTLTLFATDRQQKEIEEYLVNLQKRLTTQIAIEARVLQVDLTDEYATGIDWDQMNLSGMIEVDPSFPSLGIATEATGGFTGVFSAGSSVRLVVEAISKFGTVRALSSPRVMVMNNQPALVNVANNNVYFSFTAETSEDADTNESTVSLEVEQRSVPEGVILTVVPSANSDTGEIMLAIRPTVSSIVDRIADPTVALIYASNDLDPADAPSNQIPVVGVQEMDSMIKLQSGQTVVMGGLMKDTNIVTEESIPVLGDIPYFGGMFRNHSDNIQKSELIIFLTARIVTGGNADDMDRKLYKKFGYDRRPVRF